MANTNSIPPESVLLSKLMSEHRIQNFDFTEPKIRTKWAGTVAGIKNAGKTTNAINMYESVLLIDFDGNGKDSKETLVSRHIMKSEDIFVLDARKYLSERPTPNDYLLNYFYIKEACKKFKGKYSGVIVDTIDGLEEMLVEKARYLYGSSSANTASKNGLTWQGWSDRTVTLIELWNLFLDTATVGVTYITDYNFFERVEENKSVTIKVPKWFDIIRRESKYLIEIDQYTDFEAEQVKVKAKMWVSKNERIMKPAVELDITGYKPIVDKRRFKEFFSESSTNNNTSSSSEVTKETLVNSGGINWS